MENKVNKYIAVSYRLYTDGEDGRTLIEETKQGEPFQFITGFGYALDEFEKRLSETEKGQEFKMTLPNEQAYGEYKDELVLTLSRDTFSINGHFDHEHIYDGAIVPLQNEEGRQFLGRIVEVGEESVKVDLNHPLAGETLYFEGVVEENREATKEEIDGMIARLTGGCSCGHEGCSDCEGCGGHHEEHDHCHEHDCHCGHCH